MVPPRIRLGKRAGRDGGVIKQRARVAWRPLSQQPFAGAPIVVGLHHGGLVRDLVRRLVCEEEGVINA